MKHGSKTFSLIMETVECLAEDFLTGDRDMDAELPRGSIEQAVKDGDVTVSEIVNRFAIKLGELIEVPVDEPGAHTGQAGHIVRSEMINTEVALMRE